MTFSSQTKSYYLGEHNVQIRKKKIAALDPSKKTSRKHQEKKRKHQDRLGGLQMWCCEV